MWSTWKVHIDLTFKPRSCQNGRSQEQTGGRKLYSQNGSLPFKTRELEHMYICRSNYALPRLIVDNGLKDLWRRENPDFSNFTCYDRSFCTRSRRDKVYTDIKLASNTKSNHIMVSFTDHYNAIDTLTSKTKTGKDSCYFNNSLLWKPEFSTTTKNLLFLLKTHKKQPRFNKWLVGIHQNLF